MAFQGHDFFELLICGLSHMLVFRSCSFTPFLVLLFFFFPFKDRSADSADEPSVRGRQGWREVPFQRGRGQHMTRGHLSFRPRVFNLGLRPGSKGP